MTLKIGGYSKQVENKLNMKPAGEKMDPVKEFGEVLGNALGEVNDMDREAGRQLELLAAGEAENVHEVMMAVQKSKIAMDFTIAIRNKAIEAYKEIMRMQM
jgi:flagellar hook-basal body complex protein FliE